MEAGIALDFLRVMARKTGFESDISVFRLDAVPSSVLSVSLPVPSRLPAGSVSI